MYLIQFMFSIKYNLCLEMSDTRILLIYINYSIKTIIIFSLIDNIK